MSPMDSFDVFLTTKTKQKHAKARMGGSWGVPRLSSWSTRTIASVLVVAVSRWMVASRWMEVGGSVKNKPWRAISQPKRNSIAEPLFSRLVANSLLSFGMVCDAERLVMMSMAVMKPE